MPARATGLCATPGLMRSRAGLVRTVVIVMLWAIGCGAATEPVGVSSATAEDRPPALRPDEPRVVLRVPGREPVVVRVEVADTEPRRDRGLMYRRHLAPSTGMLFVFDRMEHQSFWMKNTFIPLDMIFIDDALRVVGVVEDATPLTEDAREVEGDSQYVLEVSAGFARRHGIGPGTVVTFENVTRPRITEEVSNARVD